MIAIEENIDKLKNSTYKIEIHFTYSKLDMENSIVIDIYEESIKKYYNRENDRLEDYYDRVMHIQSKRIEECLKKSKLTLSYKLLIIGESSLKSDKDEIVISFNEIVEEDTSPMVEIIPDKEQEELSINFLYTRILIFNLENEFKKRKISSDDFEFMNDVLNKYLNDILKKLNGRQPVISVSVDNYKENKKQNKISNEEPVVSIEDIPKINLNTAKYADFLKIPGFNIYWYEKILIYREKNLFKSIDELRYIDGIGKKKFERLKTYFEV
ncbi:helix-hairpin-helix domain-containing protein [Ruminiclostridium cellobioparum]|uniref:Competence protein ComEA helix-hairpin-helix repeat region n=1 Tax=Ruminiclostridium cellobioparum subsp. termitidis CT1112 TaxID=1195236 RepID=S0FQA2_RUMCE|nr:helix-hairpin-helix domain-containing protein [Ruminiclostridium cellobioparum]EMS74042.1 hypothetical protein CTER_5129 [Ruminiclostridium cellobioparum subsp. termitidis CT1112]